MSEFSREEKSRLKELLLASFEAATTYDGSEASENNLFSSLTLFEDFSRSLNEGSTSGEWEQKISEVAFPNHPVDMPTNVDGFLEVASSLYDRILNAKSDFDIWEALEGAGAVIKDSDSVFVKTDEGNIAETTSETPSSYEVRTEPRLAILVSHLRNDGVNGQSVYMDDLVITRGNVDKNMMRERPYNIVQIPRLNMEVAVCDQVGETTFVKRGAVGTEFWNYLTKDQLKARDDVFNVDRRSDEQWWSEISGFLMGNSKPTAKKVKVKSWSNKKVNLDTELIKESLLTHIIETGEWLTGRKKGEDGKFGGYVLEYGAYAGKITAGALNANLVKGFRGLPGGSSIPKLNQEISIEQNLDYTNHLNKEDLDTELIKSILLTYRLEAGDWLACTKHGSDGEIGGYQVEYGASKEKIRVGTLNTNLMNGGRGLPGGSSIAQLNQEVSDTNNLDYVNHLELEKLNISQIKDSLLAHRVETGEWLKSSDKTDDNESYVLEYGTYAGEINVCALEHALFDGLRGLPGGSSIARLNKEVSDTNDLDYVNSTDKEKFNMKQVRNSLLAHARETGELLSVCKQGDDGECGSYVLAYGELAGKISVGQLDSALYKGNRGLPGGSSIAKINNELKEEIASQQIHGDSYDPY